MRFPQRSQELLWGSVSQIGRRVFHGGLLIDGVNLKRHWRSHPRRSSPCSTSSHHPSPKAESPVRDGVRNEGWLKGRRHVANVDIRIHALGRHRECGRRAGGGRVCVVSLVDSVSHPSIFTVIGDEGHQALEPVGCSYAAIY